VKARQADVRVGCAGWSLPRAVARRFPAEGTHLQRYAARLNCAEINSSFYRPHQPAIYARWAESVPADFRFSVKLPRAITHDARLRGAGAALTSFADEVAGLGQKLGGVLVQLPPSLAFDARVADTFFSMLRRRVASAIACEPRHPSWFLPAVDVLWRRHDIARVAADPARVPAAAEPGGDDRLVYFRLHGSPRMYYSDYEPERLAPVADRIAMEVRAERDTW